MAGVGGACHRGGGKGQLCTAVPSSSLPSAASLPASLHTRVLTGCHPRPAAARPTSPHLQQELFLQEGLQVLKKQGLTQEGPGPGGGGGGKEHCPLIRGYMLMCDRTPVGLGASPRSLVLAHRPPRGESQGSATFSWLVMPSTPHMGKQALPSAGDTWWPWIRMDVHPQ